MKLFVTESKLYKIRDEARKPGVERLEKIEAWAEEALLELKRKDYKKVKMLLKRIHDNAW